MLGLIRSRPKRRTLFQVQELEDRRLLSGGLLPALPLTGAVLSSAVQPIQLAVNPGPATVAVQTGLSAPTATQAIVGVQASLTAPAQTGPGTPTVATDVGVQPALAGTGVALPGPLDPSVLNPAIGAPGGHGSPRVSIPPAALPGLVSQTASLPGEPVAPAAPAVAPPGLVPADELGGGGGEAALVSSAPAVMVLVPPVTVGQTAHDSGAVVANPAEENPAPVTADLLTDVVPGRRAILPAVLQDVLDQADHLGARLTNTLTAAGMAPWLLAAAAAAVAVEIARRRLWQARSGLASTGEADHAFFPGDDP